MYHNMQNIEGITEAELWRFLRANALKAKQRKKQLSARVRTKF